MKSSYSYKLHILATVTLIGYMLIAVFGFLQVSMMPHSSHTGHTCPFNLTEAVYCTMDATSHSKFWSDIVSGSAKSGVGMVLLALPLYGYVFLYRDTIRASSVATFVSTDVPSLYQELFSRGILHPKAP